MFIDEWTAVPPWWDSLLSISSTVKLASFVNVSNMACSWRTEVATSAKDTTISPISDVSASGVSRYRGRIVLDGRFNPSLQTMQIGCGISS